MHMSDDSKIAHTKFNTQAFTHLTQKEIEGERKLDELEELAKGWVNGENATNRAIINAKAQKR